MPFCVTGITPEPSNRSPVGGRCQDAYLWLDWISIPQIVEDSETSDGDESREISGRLRRRSRGLRMSLRSFRGLDGDVGAEGGRKVKKRRVTKWTDTVWNTDGLMIQWDSMGSWITRTFGIQYENTKSTEMVKNTFW